MKSIIEVNNLNDLDTALTETIPCVEGIFDKNKDDWMLESILKQLKYLVEWRKNGSDVLDPLLKDLTFGLLASKSMEDIDANLSMQLYEISNFIDAQIGSMTDINTTQS